MTRLDNLLRHIRNVRENCELMGERLILQGDEELGIKLIAQGNVHDNSKFYGIEWEYLNDGAWPKDNKNEVEEELFRAAIRQHTLTNSHHPEYHRGIENMGEVDLCELIADWKARSNEQGTDILEFIKDKGASKYKYSLQSRVYRDLKKYAELLLEKKF